MRFRWSLCESRSNRSLLEPSPIEASRSSSSSIASSSVSRCQDTHCEYALHAAAKAVSDARRAFTYLVESAALMSPIPAVTPVIRTPISKEPLFKKEIAAKQIADTIVREPRIVVFMNRRLYFYGPPVKRFYFLRTLNKPISPTRRPTSREVVLR